MLPRLWYVYCSMVKVLVRYCWSNSPGLCISSGASIASSSGRGSRPPNRAVPVPPPLHCRSRRLLHLCCCCRPQTRLTHPGSPSRDGGCTWGHPVLVAAVKSPRLARTGSCPLSGAPSGWQRGLGGSCTCLYQVGNGGSIPVVLDKSKGGVDLDCGPTCIRGGGRVRGLHQHQVIHSVIEGRKNGI